ncbi:MAG: EF-P lysine aminoacylase GenX, partial [Deltaproteobacteria bacterium]
LRVDGRDIDVAAPFVRLSVSQAFVRFAGFDIVQGLTQSTLRPLLAQQGIHCGDDDSWDDLYHRAFLQLVEPQLARFAQPVFLTHFPAPLCSLAQMVPDDPQLSERFELLVGGVELANGFGELTDAAVLRERFVAAQHCRSALGKHNYPLDENFLLALQGLPEAAGIALGLDRLLMMLQGAADMDEVSALPWEHT